MPSNNASDSPNTAPSQDYWGKPVIPYQINLDARMNRATTVHGMPAVYTGRAKRDEDTVEWYEVEYLDKARTTGLCAWTTNAPRKAGLLLPMLGKIAAAFAILVAVLWLVTTVASAILP